MKSKCGTQKLMPRTYSVMYRHKMAAALTQEVTQTLSEHVAKTLQNYIVSTVTTDKA